MPILITGILIFLARVIDVTLGTLRTLSIVTGKMKTAFLLGFVEISIWLFIISKVLEDILREPILGVFYSLGYATGNVVGIMIEKKISFGHTVIRVIIPLAEKQLADKIREAGFAITTFIGEGMKGPVTELCIACQKDESEKIISIIKRQIPVPFYITEQAIDISRIFRPSFQQPTGWRSVFKKK
ncbi:MAG: DUF5698 domain-containing protein [Spirochaetia bacterium]|nr:DUF5698 domain-containing protein [Spirochaetia bacterium]